MSRPRTRASVDACEVFDINELNRRGHLPTPPADETWISFRITEGNGNGQTVTQYLRVERVPRHFGGVRPYFRCWCGRRAEKLYQLCGHGFYRCRRCQNLAYQSQREDAADRAFRRLGKIKARLGGDPDILASFPPKPRDMWRRTYERHWHRYLEAEARAGAAFDTQFAAVLRRGLK